MTDWTTDPPSEPGWYWCRWASDKPPSYCVIELDSGGVWYEIGSDEPLQSYDLGDRELWPVPIQPPGEGAQ